MSCLQTIRVINGRDNTDGLVFGLVAGSTSTLWDFASVTRMTLEFEVDGVTTTIDSDTDPGAIDWSAGDGEVEFALGDQAIPVGTYAARLYIYSPAYPSGYLMDVGGEGMTCNIKVI